MNATVVIGLSLSLLYVTNFSYLLLAIGQHIPWSISSYRIRQGMIQKSINKYISYP